MEAFERKHGIILGAGLGMIFGAAFGSAGIGLVLGAAIGLVLESLFNKGIDDK